MEFIQCPYCLGYNVTTNDYFWQPQFAYKCLTCNKCFNTTDKTVKFKTIKVKRTIEKQLAFPPIKPTNLKGYECLIVGSNAFNCRGMHCDDCLFRKENYEILINSKEGE